MPRAAAIELDARRRQVRVLPPNPVRVSVALDKDVAQSSLLLCPTVLLSAKRALLECEGANAGYSL